VLIRQFEVGDFNIFSYLVGDEEGGKAPENPDSAPEACAAACS
jgi:hypothetical protein